MSKFFSIITFASLIVAFSIFASSNLQIIPVNVFATGYIVETPLYIFTFIIALMFFVLGGLYASGYNLLKDFKIFWLNRKIKKISKMEKSEKNK